MGEEDFQNIQTTCDLTPAQCSNTQPPVTNSRPPPGQTLSTFFGPFIPIFLPWVDRWVQGPWKYPPGMIRAVQSLMRKNVAYITVSQNDEGLAGR